MKGARWKILKQLHDSFYINIQKGLQTGGAYLWIKWEKSGLTANGQEANFLGSQKCSKIVLVMAAQLQSFTENKLFTTYNEWIYKV